MTTVRDMAKYIHRIGTLRTVEAFDIEVVVVDVRTVFNRIDFQVEPRFGSGKTWVEAKRVKIKEAE
jgi:hypothetical protein